MYMGSVFKNKQKIYGHLEKIGEKGSQSWVRGVVAKLWTTPTKIFLASQVNFHHGKVHQHVIFEIPLKKSWAIYKNLLKLTLYYCMFCSELLNFYTLQCTYDIHGYRTYMRDCLEAHKSRDNSKTAEAIWM